MAMPPGHENGNMLELFETHTATNTDNILLNTYNTTSSVESNESGDLAQFWNDQNNIDKATSVISTKTYVTSSTAIPPPLQSHEQTHAMKNIQPSNSHDDINMQCTSNGIEVKEMNHRRNIFSTNNKHSDVSGGFYPASREDVLQRLSEALLRRSLHKIDLSQRNLQPSDARLVKMALAQNASLTELKLGYNNLGNSGVITLAAGIVAHKSLNLLDLGFNNIGDEGIQALAVSLQNSSDISRLRVNKNGIEYDGCSTLHTLYLAGNLISEAGAMAMADFLIQGSRLRKLFMTGNRIGGDGVKAITEAILEQEMRNQTNIPIQGKTITKTINTVPASTVLQAEALDLNNFQQNLTATTKASIFHGMHEIYLGGTGMDLTGCLAVSRLLEHSCYLRVLSIPNCDIGDDEIIMLASSIKSNTSRLPIESLQLSFNNISHQGLDAVANALWGSKTLKEFKVDNNSIGDRGAHQMAAIIPSLKAFKVLDVGFNSITAAGLSVLMKTIAESQTLTSLSVSGNVIDANAAKSVAYALAYNCSLQSIFLVHCSIGHEEQRHISAGIVSNSQTALDKLTGFEIGPILLTLGFPMALKNWTNEQVFNFIHLMWDKNVENEYLQSEIEGHLDPLNFLSNPMNQDEKRISSLHHSGPIEASTVVEVAKVAFENLIANGIDVTSRQPPKSNYPSIASPLVTSPIIMESPHNEFTSNYANCHSESHSCNVSGKIKSTKLRSFVAHPESPRTKKEDRLDTARRKERIVEWLNSNSRALGELSQIPFDSRELWKLHQFYFTPVVKESGVSSCEDTEDNLFISSVPEVHRMNQNDFSFTHSAQSGDDRSLIPMSDPAFSGPASSSISMLKRKVSYRFLGDATPASNVNNADVQCMHNAVHTESVSKIIEQGHTGHSLPPKTKRARRNRTRISFLPRIKTKLDGYLNVCHEKALVTMRQLYFVEQAILSGKVNPIDANVIMHLSGRLAHDAEMIIVDMT